MIVATMLLVRILEYESQYHTMQYTSVLFEVSNHAFILHIVAR